MAGQAQDICGTPQGERLRLLASWCTTHRRVETEEEGVITETPGLRYSLHNMMEKLTNRIKVIKK